MSARLRSRVVFRALDPPAPGAFGATTGLVAVLVEPRRPFVRPFKDDGT